MLLLIPWSYHTRIIDKVKGDARKGWEKLPNGRKNKPEYAERAVLIGNMSFVGPRPDVPGYADKLQGDDRDVLKLRPGITGPATLKYRLEDEMIADYISKMKNEESRMKNGIPAGLTEQEIAVWYNDNVIYPDKVRLNCYYYRHYSFIKDIQMILCTVLGKKMVYAGEVI